ncbi:hypothetical protein LT493_21825 [Streptomyces tricolor]|nr:hypothetical protein [Streptomyces tricolor]
MAVALAAGHFNAGPTWWRAGVVLGAYLPRPSWPGAGRPRGGRRGGHGLARERATWRPSWPKLVAQAPGSSREHGDDAAAGDGSGRGPLEGRRRLRPHRAGRVEPGARKPGTRGHGLDRSEDHLVSRPSTASEAAFRSTLIGLPWSA